MNYLGNANNIVPDADLVASNLAPSNAVYRIDTAPKEGKGDVKLDGPYTGQHDTTIDVEILGDEGAAAVPSLPIFTGVGNGTMTEVEMTGLDPQQFTITLDDVGTQTLRAYAPFQGVTLRAVETGNDGNLISLTVESFLSYAPTPYALQNDLQEGQNDYVGGQWDFGAVVLTPEGFIPANAPRLRIGNDPQVYRQFKKYINGRYHYSFSPAPVRTVQKGAKVRTVTGDRTLTITDGVDTNTLTGIITLYDALIAIRDMADPLIYVDGAIQNKREPGGQAVVELSVASESYAASVIGEGSSYASRADIALVVAPDAPSETLTIQCVENLVTGREKWTVLGDVSTALPNAETGVPYAAGPYEFLIPTPEIPAAVVGSIDVEFEPVDRAEGETMPAFRAERPLLGSAPVNGTYTFVLTRVPPEECDVDDADLVGGPRQECLGVDPGLFTDIGGSTVSESIRLVRFQKITRAVREWMQTNTSAKNLATANSPYTIPNDVKFVNRVSTIYKNAIDKLVTGTLDWGSWVASTLVAQDLIREPVTRNGYRYAATTPGTTGASEPNWSTALTLDSTVSDGTVVWTNIGKRPLTMYDEALTAFIAEITDTVAGGIIGEPIAGPYGPQWGEFNGTVTANNDVDFFVRPSQGNAADGYIYLLMSGTVATGGFGTEPTWSTTVGALQTVATEDSVGADYSAVVQCVNRYWAPSSPVTADLTMETGNGWVMVCTQSGTTDSTMPTWPLGTAAAEITDGTAKWNFKRGESTSPNPGNNVLQTIDGSFYERYVSRMTEVLAAAGIDANFEGSSGGDGCWTDLGTELWWVEINGRHLPIFTNVYYHAAITQMVDGQNVAMATKEWGFGPHFGCPEALKPGDRMIVTIAGSIGANGYQQGDRFNASIVLAEPLGFGGGQSGNDTQTWSVRSDINGRLPDYLLNFVTPTAYDEDGLSFLINQGGIRYAAGDQFVINGESGTFQYRQDGGAWEGPYDIGLTALVDGLTVRFVGGRAPSYVEGDRWTFRAEATNGPDGVRSLTDPVWTWTAAANIVVSPEGDTEIDALAICDHTIPSNATITFSGSDDNFSTTVFSVNVPWAERHIFFRRAADCAKYRVAISAAGSMQWLWMGRIASIKTRDNATDWGNLVKRVRMPGLFGRRATGGTITHEMLNQVTIDWITELLAYACEFDDRRLLVIPNEDEDEALFVTYRDESLQIDDALGFQPRNPLHRMQNITLELEPV